MRMRRRITRRRRLGRAEGGSDFASWGEVLEHARSGAPLYYKAPMDYRAVRFRPIAAGEGVATYTYKVKARTIRMWPPGSVGRGRLRTSDPFTANAGHLDRFSKTGG